MRLLPHPKRGASAAGAADPSAPAAQQVELVGGTLQDVQALAPLSARPKTVHNRANSSIVRRTSAVAQKVYNVHHPNHRLAVETGVAAASFTEAIPSSPRRASAAGTPAAVTGPAASATGAGAGVSAVGSWISRHLGLAAASAAAATVASSAPMRAGFSGRSDSNPPIDDDRKGDSFGHATAVTSVSASSEPAAAAAAVAFVRPEVADGTKGRGQFRWAERPLLTGASDTGHRSLGGNYDGVEGERKDLDYADEGGEGADSPTSRGGSLASQDALSVGHVGRFGGGLRLGNSSREGAYDDEKYGPDTPAAASVVIHHSGLTPTAAANSGGADHELLSPVSLGDLSSEEEEGNQLDGSFRSELRGGVCSRGVGSIGGMDHSSDDDDWLEEASEHTVKGGRKQSQPLVHHQQQREAERTAHVPARLTAPRKGSGASCESGGSDVSGCSSFSKAAGASYDGAASVGGSSVGTGYHRPGIPSITRYDVRVISPEPPTQQRHPVMMEEGGTSLVSPELSAGRSFGHATSPQRQLHQQRGDFASPPVDGRSTAKRPSAVHRPSPSSAVLSVLTTLHEAPFSSGGHQHVPYSLHSSPAAFGTTSSAGAPARLVGLPSPRLGDQALQLASSPSAASSMHCVGGPAAVATPRSVTPLGLPPRPAPFLSPLAAAVTSVGQGLTSVAWHFRHASSSVVAGAAANALASASFHRSTTSGFAWPQFSLRRSWVAADSAADGGEGDITSAAGNVAASDVTRISPPDATVAAADVARVRASAEG